MTRERIEDFREIVLPFLSRTLLETNYENLGKSDAEEFEKDFNEILNLAIKALEQKSTIEVLQEIREEISCVSISRPITDGINTWGIQARMGDAVKEEILELIDRHIKEIEHE